MVAARTLTKKQLALESAHRRARVGPKTRVGVFSQPAAARVGARARGSRETRWEISARRREVAVGSRWYLQPEPLLSIVNTPESVQRMNYVAKLNGDLPRGGAQYIAEQAKEGLSTPVYSYARNNPITNIDPDGLDTFSVGCGQVGDVTLELEVTYPHNMSMCEMCASETKKARIVRGTSMAGCAKKLAEKVCRIADREGGKKCNPPKAENTCGSSSGRG
jgi:hypothetical protein